MEKGNYAVTMHAIRRFLEQVEGVTPEVIERPEMERVKAVILGVPAARIAVRSYATVTVRAAWGKIVIKDGSVVTIAPVDTKHRLKLDKRDHKSRYGRRTRAHRVHAEGVYS